MFKDSREKALHVLAKAIPDGSCLEHSGWVGENGYGRINFGGKCHLAHRFVYAGIVGKIPPGCAIHHKCANRACINPEHLQPVTARENTAEMLERNYYLKCIEDLEAENRKLKKLVSV
ncbi:HNH endonuclease signature motif containing protein [Streptomyces sp. NPDC059928]|uniref:HNH endonuclease signature motif containing protein n=1 Tax=unclassified Streptomyces TaxID=2593676 RepID=UPI003668F861